jgi:hypothetical protein
VLLGCMIGVIVDGVVGFVVVVGVVNASMLFV